MSTSFILPDLFAVCSFKPSFNPHYEAVSAESAAWIRSYNINLEQSWSQTSSELLVANACPDDDYEQFRTSCDALNIMYLMDMVSEENTSEGFMKKADSFYNAVRDADWDDGSQFAKMGKAFRTRLFRDPRPVSFPRYLDSFKIYIESVGKEIEYRERDHILDLETFQTLRREFCAMRPLLVMIIYALDADISDEVYNHPILMNMHVATLDMIFWSNDLYSYRREEAMGQASSNVMTILMKERNLDLQGAADAIKVHYKELVDGFLADEARLPSWGPDIDHLVAGYVKGMKDWIIGNMVWSFQTPRYFGVDRDEIKRTGVVHLRPRDMKI